MHHQTIATTLLAGMRLMRADRPVGTVLLACPMLWALWLASAGQPSPYIVLIFLLGAFIMRSAGCVINDFADRHVDRRVERTKTRPLTSGQISEKATLILFFSLVLCALGLLCLLPTAAILPACVSLGLACWYPFTKRYFRIPQLVLGMAYSSSVLMAYVTVSGTLSAPAWVLFVAVVLWTIVYDTYYAMIDRNDDIDIGIHSSALWFGNYDLLINTVLTLLFVGLMLAVGVLNGLNGYYYLGLSLACGCFVYQLIITRNRSRETCFIAFLNNQWVGVLVFIGILLAYL